MKEPNDRKWTIAEVLTNFGQRQAQSQQEKMLKQQLKDALMQNQANALSQFVPGMQQQMPSNPEDMPFDEYYQQAKRGGIKLDPRKKGTFKAQATRMGMSVQQAAAHILANKEKYSPAMVKKANFARNFAKEEGGEIMQYNLGGNMMACPDGMYWNGTACVEIPNKITNRSIKEIYTNPPRYSVSDNLGTSLYDGKDYELAKGYYAIGSDYGNVTPEIDAYENLKQALNARKSSGRTIEMVYTNPVTYIVRDANGTVMYEGTNDTLAKSIHAGNNSSSSKMSPSMIRIDNKNEHDSRAKLFDELLKKIPQQESSNEYKAGGMIKRADGSYSQRGLWDNIRANRGSGKKPTKEMLEQERKIKRKYFDGGIFACDEGYEWSEELQVCVPIVTDTYAKDFLTDWYARRGEIVNDPNFSELPESEEHAKWLGKILPGINERLETSNVKIEYPEVINDDAETQGMYLHATKKEGPKIQIANIVRQFPFDHAATQLHEYTTESTAGPNEKFINTVQQRIVDSNIKDYEEFRDTSPLADEVKSNKDMDDELYGQYMYSTGQTPEGMGNMHSYVMNWRKAFNMDPTKVYSEDEVGDMVAQAEKSGMLTKGSVNYNDDLYKLYRLAKDNKGLANLFNLLANNKTPQNPNRLNDEITYAKYGGNFGYMPDFF